jgi:hypothetical protein
MGLVMVTIIILQKYTFLSRYYNPIKKASDLTELSHEIGSGRA